VKATVADLLGVIKEEVNLSPEAMARVKSAIKGVLDPTGTAGVEPIAQAVSSVMGDDVSIDVEKFIEDEMSSDVTRHAKGAYVELSGLAEKRHITTRSELRSLIFEVIAEEEQPGEDIDNEIISDGAKASGSTGKPYRGSRLGKTESQAQQMAAGIALRAVDKYGKEGAIRRLKGASKSMAAMKYKDLKKLATIRRGSEVPDSTKKGHERSKLPGHIKKST
tara:strand:+ start:3575 stop:4237 length:663 start_codon:yes stop_codon:yes gene_type:complete